MIVQAVDDINLKILSDSAKPERKGHFVLYPNSVRRDIPMDFAYPDAGKTSPRPYGGTECVSVDPLARVDDRERPEERAGNTRTKCVHCRQSTDTGIHGGCGSCRKVKATSDGKRPPRQEQE